MGVGRKEGGIEQLLGVFVRMTGTRIRAFRQLQEMLCFSFHQCSGDIPFRHVAAYHQRRADARMGESNLGHRPN